jgi:hypothetical protein
MRGRDGEQVFCETQVKNQSFYGGRTGIFPRRGSLKMLPPLPTNGWVVPLHTVSKHIREHE